MSKNKVFRLTAVLLSLFMTVFLFPASVEAEIGTAFTYQGQLLATGLPASGSYDFQFTLYDSQSGGAVIGSTINQTLNVTNGYFCTNLDFGSEVFKGDACWLETAVRTAGTGSYTTLDQRQPLNPSPYAIYAASIADAAVTPAKINPDGASSGQALIYDGTNVTWGNVPGTIDTTGATSGQALMYNGTNAAWSSVPGTIDTAGATSGQALVFNGSSSDWNTPINPSQIGTTGADIGQALVFDGATAAWKDVSGGAAPQLYFNQIYGPIAVFPPMSTEVTIASLAVPVEAGQTVKMDYSLGLELFTTANWNSSFEIRLYRNATMIDSNTVADANAVAGTYKSLLSSTCVDVSPTTGTSTYSVRVIFTAATNITSSTTTNRSINAICFP